MAGASVILTVVATDADDLSTESNGAIVFSIIGNLDSFCQHLSLFLKGKIYCYFFSCKFYIHFVFVLLLLSLLIIYLSLIMA